MGFTKTNPATGDRGARQSRICKDNSAINNQSPKPAQDCALPAMSDRLQEAEALVALGLAMTGRSCGDCSLCCKLLPIEGDNFSKPADQWCGHCKPGNGGCSIYQSRPAVCRGFACQWLVDKKWGDHWQPTRSKMVVHLNAEDGIHLNIDVDVGRPGIWREEPYLSDIRRAALHGLITGSFLTRVIMGKRRWLILPDGEEEMRGRDVIVLPVGPGKWKALWCNSKTERRELQQALQQIERVLRPQS